jgi:hypothetical protein
VIAMSRTLSRSSLVLALVTVACGRPKPELDSEARKLDEPIEQADAASPSASERRLLTRKRPASSMPETFAAFPRPELAELDGVWLVDAKLPNRGVVWAIDDGGSTLTTIDRHGRELLYGITLTSPCALRLTDNTGRAQSRSIALSDEQLIVSSKGAIAVAAPDGSLLACAGHRTYQIAADGRCRYTTEMLGAWSDPVEAKDACTLETVDGARALTIAGQQLREHEGGIWYDDVAAADVAVRMDDRAAAIAALTPTPAAGEATSSETGEPVAAAPVADE